MQPGMWKGSQTRHQRSYKIVLTKKKLGKQWLRNYILRWPWHPLLGLQIRLSSDWRDLILDPQRGGGYEFRSLEVTKQGVLGGSVEVKGAH